MQQSTAIHPRRVIIFGRMYRSWQPALAAESGTWDGLAGVDDVTAVRRRRSLPRFDGPADSIVIALSERAIRHCPRGGWTLLPSPRAVRLLEDKVRFARYAEAQGLADYVPARFTRPSEAQFPCVLKRARGAAGRSVRIAGSASELAAFRRQRRFLFRRVLLQEFVHAGDCVTHAVCRGGRIVLHRTYAHQLASGTLIQTPDRTLGVTAEVASPDELAIMERFLRPLGYDGPVCIDFKRRPDGRPCILEINPRFGGSLMRPENRADLREALAAYVAHARPPQPRASWRWAQVVLSGGRLAEEERRG